MPVQIASLAHTMIQMPTCFKMFKRMLLYYKRHGRGMRIPALATFRWPNAQELEQLLAMVLRLQCAYRRHLGVKRMQDLIYERAERAQVENIIKAVQRGYVGDHSTVDATMSIREGLTTRQGTEEPDKEHLSTHFELTEAEELWLHKVNKCPVLRQNVVYLASRDGWDPAVFGTLCKDKENLLMLVASSSPAHGGINGETTHIFGAYTSLPWQRHGGFKPDPDAYLFSLRASGPAGHDSALQMFQCEQTNFRDFAVLHHRCVAQVTEWPLMARGVPTGDVAGRRNLCC